MAKYVWLDSSCQWKLKGHAWLDETENLSMFIQALFFSIFHNILSFTAGLCPVALYLQAEIMNTTKYITTRNKKFQQRSTKERL